jgi:membrane protein
VAIVGLSQRFANRVPCANQRMPARARGRAKAVQQWLAQRADTPVKRLALRWFRRYFEASQNSACAATLYMFLSVGPLVLAAAGLFNAAGSDTNAFAQRLIDHQALSGETARLVHDTFGSASDNALAASVLAVIGFLTWGIGIGQIYQDVYARAWRVHVRTLSDQARFTIWFFVLSGALGLFLVFAGSLNTAGWAVVVPIWLVASTAFWLWTPRYLLHRQIGLRQLLPGALLASLLIGGATATSRFYLGHGLATDGRQFGSFGVVIALVAWGLILVLISMLCAVFAPVWAEWRENERSDANN